MQMPTKSLTSRQMTPLSLPLPSLIAPIYDGNPRRHNMAFFVHHTNQRDWVLDVIERLEMPPISIQCTYLEQIVMSHSGISVHQVS